MSGGAIITNSSVTSVGSRRIGALRWTMDSPRGSEDFQTRGVGSARLDARAWHAGGFGTRRVVPANIQFPPHGSTLVSREVSSSCRPRVEGPKPKTTTAAPQGRAAGTEKCTCASLGAVRCGAEMPPSIAMGWSGLMSCAAICPLESYIK
jgi:hypothetical protein